ncbi:hypothetical protein [Undibacterium sp. Tian12W]|uniref:hypothetical protein n=1 Tax=Undibacterium sp. Tian12W TaxID=3413054 RepID=UPI003BF3247A
MKKLAIVMMLLFLSACAGRDKMILESRDVQAFEVAEHLTAKSSSITISGLAFHSALAVQEVRTIPEGKALHVYVHLAPAHANSSGSFSSEIVIPATVETIYFGLEKTVIWQRKSPSEAS